MAKYVLNGNDTLTIDGVNINDFSDGTIIEISHPNQIANIVTGKDGNTIFAKNETGLNASLVLRILRGSSNDRFMNGRLIAQQASPETFTLMAGTFVKHLGDGLGNQMRDTFDLMAGVFVSLPDVTTSVAGDTEQATTVYTIQFAASKRSLS